MQAVVVILTVLQKKWCRVLLAGLAATPLKLRMLRRVARSVSQKAVPAVCNRHQVPVKHGAQRGDRLGQRVAEVLILAPTKTMATHHYPAAKDTVLRVKRCEPTAFSSTENAMEEGAALLVEFLGHR